jgi:hypothetical protein
MSEKGVIQIKDDQGRVVFARIDNPTNFRGGEKDSRVFYCSKYAMTKGLIPIAVVASSVKNNWSSGWDLYREGRDGSFDLQEARRLAREHTMKRVKSLRAQTNKAERFLGNLDWPEVAPWIE